jgi:hypothetical protein
MPEGGCLTSDRGFSKLWDDVLSAEKLIWFANFLLAKSQVGKMVKKLKNVTI